MKECLAKAEEALRAAEVCFDAGLYDSCASRCYYAMFWAGIEALEYVGYASQQWSHGGLANVFGKELTRKRRLVSPKLAAHLREGYTLRSLADYNRIPIGKRKAERALRYARALLAAIREVVS